MILLVKTRTALNRINELYGNLWLEDGIIHLASAPNLNFTIDIARRINDKRLEICAGSPKPFLIDISSATYVEMQTREFWARGEGSRLLSAKAFIVQNDLQRLIFNAFHIINKPPFPSKIFKSVEEAVQWLNFFKHLN